MILEDLICLLLFNPSTDMFTCLKRVYLSKWQMAQVHKAVIMTTPTVKCNSVQGKATLLRIFAVG